MKSTEMIHAIIENNRTEDNRKLYLDLISLRHQVKNEVLKKLNNCSSLIKLLYYEREQETN